MKDVIYFLHDYNAHSDPKIVKVIMKYGREGYGLYRASLEIMREDANVIIKQCELSAIAFRLHYDQKKYEEIILFFVEVGLLVFDEDEEIFYSERLQENVEYMREKSQKARRSAEERRKKRERKNANALQTQSERNAIKERKGKEKKGKEIKEKQILSKDKTVNTEYGSDQINNLISLIKEACKEQGVIYSGKGQLERRACKRILSKKFQENISQFNMNLKDFIFNVILVSTKLKYSSKPLSSAKDIYYNREDVINKAKSQKVLSQKEDCADLTPYLQ